MKLAHLSTLSIAVIMASSAQGNAFVEDASLDIHLRNYFKGNSYKNDQQMEDSHSQWAQAVRLNFSSGYLVNLVGVDLGAQHSLKIRGDKNSDNGLLHPDSNGNADGYGKTSYALKINLFDMGVAKYGRLFIDTPLLSDSDSRALTSLTEGFYAEGQYDALGLYGVIAIERNFVTTSGFQKFGNMNANNEFKNESVNIIGGTYDFGHGLTTHLAYGKQKNTEKRYLADVKYSTNLQAVGLDFGVQYAKNTVIGDQRTENQSSGTTDSSQHTWGAMGTAHIGAVSIGVAYTAVQKTQLNDFDFEWSVRNPGEEGSVGDEGNYFGYNAVQYSDFNKGGQKAWGLNASYNLNDMIEGLSVYGAYVTGKVHRQDDNGDNLSAWTEKEYNLGLSYYLPMIEGLSAHLMYAYNTEKDQGENDSGDTTDLINKDTRVIVKYDIAVF